MVIGPSKKLIFITGASRSGTTLMSFVLRRHREVFGLKELHYFGEFWDPRRTDAAADARHLDIAAAAIFGRQERGLGRFIDPISESDRLRARDLLESLPPESRNLSGLFYEAVHRIAAAAGKSIPCEQTPRNIFYAEALLRHYPEARVVHMVRDPRAVMASQKRRWRRRALLKDPSRIPLFQVARSWVNYHPYTMAHLWLRASTEAHRLATHPRFSIVRFEDLLADPETVIRGLCTRLDIEFEPQMLEIDQINSSHASAINGPPKGFRKEAIDAWKACLTSAEVIVTERICETMMARFGYERSHGDRLRSPSEILFVLTYLAHLAGAFVVDPRRAWIQLQAAQPLRYRRSTAGPPTSAPSR
jgi:hypothetical protein